MTRSPIGREPAAYSRLWPLNTNHVPTSRMEGFEVLRRRWVVERTFAWIVKNRRFVRDYEQLTAVAETLIIVAATATLIRRWP